MLSESYIMKSEMLKILGALNPWWKGSGPFEGSRPPVERVVFPALARLVLAPDERRAAILLGPRQVGKTTLAHMVIADALRRGWPPKNILYVDLELDPFRGARLLDLVEGRPVQPSPDWPVLFVLDEVQFCTTWAEELKVLVDRRAGRFLLTGSASRELLLGMDESLPGRYDRFSLFGLSLREFVELRELCGIRSLPLREHLQAYLELGGFPEHACSRDVPLVRRRILEDVAMRAISHDIVARLSGEIRNDVGLRHLFYHLVEHPGAKLNLDGLAREVEVSHVTAKKWLGALEEASLLRPLQAMTCGARPTHRRGKQPKIYPCDPGIVSAYTVTGDYGRRAETAVFRHLQEAVEDLDGRSEHRAVLGYWEDGANGEIDFLLHQGDRLLAVEVTTSDPVPTEKLEAFDRACNKLAPASTRRLLVCLEPTRRTYQGNGLPIEVVPLEAFLMDCSNPEGLFDTDV